MAGNNIPRPGQAGPAPEAPVARKTYKGYAAGGPQATELKIVGYGAGTGLLPDQKTYWPLSCAIGALAGFGGYYNVGGSYGNYVPGEGYKPFKSPDPLPPGLREEIMADIQKQEEKFATFMFAVLAEYQTYWDVIRDCLLERGWKELCVYKNMYSSHVNDKYMCHVFVWCNPKSKQEWGKV